MITINILTLCIVILTTEPSTPITSFKLLSTMIIQLILIGIAVNQIHIEEIKTKDNDEK
jgi:hypothetical protein